LAEKGKCLPAAFPVQTWQATGSKVIAKYMPKDFIWGPVSGMTTKNTTMVHIRYFSLCIFSGQSKSCFAAYNTPQVFYSAYNLRAHRGLQFIGIHLDILFQFLVLYNYEKSRKFRAAKFSRIAPQKIGIFHF
jgi:hypothetical protein